MTAIGALAEGPGSLADLRRKAGTPPQTTMRGYLRSLAEAGVVERSGEGELAGGVGYKLTAAGHDLLAVSGALAAWLGRSPRGPIRLSSAEAKSAIKSLIDCWSTGMLRAFAARPLSLTQLDSLITSLSYPSLERRLAALRLFGMVEAAPGEGRSTPYRVTDWLRAAVAPLAAASRWERAHRSSQAPPITNLDVEAGFLLALPLVQLPATASGSCRLAVKTTNGRRDGLVGVTVEARRGAVVSCVTGLAGRPDASAQGPVSAWLSAIIEHDAGGLDLAGNASFAAGVVAGMHAALFST